MDKVYLVVFENMYFGTFNHYVFSSLDKAAKFVVDCMMGCVDVKPTDLVPVNDIINQFNGHVSYYVNAHYKWEIFKKTIDDIDDIDD